MTLKLKTLLLNKGQVSSEDKIHVYLQAVDVK